MHFFFDRIQPVRLSKLFMFRWEKFGQNQTDLTKKSLSERLSRERPPIRNLSLALSWDNQLK